LHDALPILAGVVWTAHMAALQSGAPDPFFATSRPFETGHRAAALTPRARVSPSRPSGSRTTFVILAYEERSRAGASHEGWRAHSASTGPRSVRSAVGRHRHGVCEHARTSRLDEGGTMTTRTGAITGIGRVPPHLAIGLALVAVAWPLAWLGPKPFSSYTFFPLWLGYILTVDGLT